MTADLYFDYNGSTPVHPEVRRVALELHEREFGNASAAHPEGRRARERIDRARAVVARALHAAPDEIFLTSGGTESNNWALQGSVPREGRRHVLVSAIEHKSVLATARALEAAGAMLTVVPVDRSGRVRLDAVEAALRADTALVSLMHANNETGVLQPVHEVGALCRARGVRFHVDAVCALGRERLDVDRLECDLLSLSSHKLYAPKGTGILYVRRGTELRPLVHGCGQQCGMRGGTENTPGIAAFARALELLEASAFPPPAALAALRDELWERIVARFPAARQNGAGPRLANTLNVCFPGHRAFEVQEALGALGISVSAGAAAATAAPSHVLLAMGLSEDDARASVRFSLGSGTTRESLAQLVAALESVLRAETVSSPGARR
ncbi:MAG: cysteine desulfurase [Planctomycetes bacterium]|nr:cysteine desulfurase [Planctomycetota bacterium]